MGTSDGPRSAQADYLYFKSVTPGQKAKIEYEDLQNNYAYMFEMGSKYDFYNRAVGRV